MYNQLEKLEIENTRLAKHIKKLNIIAEMMIVAIVIFVCLVVQDLF